MQSQEDQDLLERLDLHTAAAGQFNATCDAFAMDEEQEHLYFLSLLGSQTAIKAMAAELMKQPPGTGFLQRGTPMHGIQLGYKSFKIPSHTTGTWTAKITRLPASRGYHGMVYTKTAEHGYDNNNFLLLARDQDELPDLYYRFLNKRSSLPMHPSWAPWLWGRAVRIHEAEKLTSAGVTAYWCMFNEELLKIDLTFGITHHELPLPD